MIGLRLPKEETVRLDKWAKANGYTRSEAIRAFIRGTQPARRSARHARPIDDANAFIREVLDFTIDYGSRLEKWRVLGRFSEEDRAEVVKNLHQCGIDFTLMAQSLDGMEQ